MIRARRAGVVVAALALGVGAGVIPASASAGKSKKKTSKVKTITVGDDYFSLAKLTIKEGQEIKWVWSRSNFDSHNVTLLSGPKKINHQKYTSKTAVFGVRFEKTFLTPGKYHFQCTVHPDSMNTILTVKK
jgi:plastocyanin